ncbi:hypothetical protein ACFX11_044341 [Malus domestica]
MVIAVKSDEFVIKVKLWDESNKCQWRLFGIYASTNERKRRGQWLELSRRLEIDRGNCLLIGDFNDILSNEEKEGGNQRMAFSIRDFREFVAQNELVDLGYEGYPFTWRNNQAARPIQLRLDRGLATSGCKSKECRDLVAGEWGASPVGSHAFQFCEKLKKLRRTLKEWELRTAHKNEETYWRTKSRNQ